MSIDRYAVFGNPVEHSKSPAIHQAFAAQANQSITYDKQRVTEHFDQAANRFFQEGGCGLNITVPFKTEAYDYADHLSERAQAAQAVNTLIRQNDGTITGDNTDGAGLLHDLTKLLGWSLTGQRVLVLGAGGAVKGVLQPLLAEKPRELVIANRTLSRAEALVRACHTPSSLHQLTSLKACQFTALGGQFDLIINGTSASLSGDLPPLSSKLVSTNTACYDMMYGPEPTVFLHWANSCGAGQLADGLGMLVSQAAESFFLWRGFKPDVVPVVALLRRQLEQLVGKTS